MCVFFKYAKVYFFVWPAETTRLDYLWKKKHVICIYLFICLYLFFRYIFVSSLTSEYIHLKQAQHLSCCWFHVLRRNLDGINLP